VSAIDQYGYQCMGIVTCPSSFQIVSFNDHARNVLIYRLDEDIPPDEPYFQGKKGDILLGGGLGEAAALQISIPEAFYFWTHEEWDEIDHWTDLCQSFWSATQAYVFGEGYSKLGWLPPDIIEIWLTHHILSFLVKNYPNEYQQYLGPEPFEEDGSICRLPDGYELWINRPPKYGRLPMENPQPRILFCEDPLDRRSPDAMYEAEVAAVRKLKLDFDLINFEALLAGDADGAVRKVVAQSAATLAVYRGWMLKPHQYNDLWYALALRNIYLINDERAYEGCHYLPESYRAIEAYTPRTVWTKDTSIDAIMLLLEPFGDQPIIVKDFVKSQKHYWLEACFIPSASDRQSVEHVVKRFLELQGDDLNEGLVFREFVEFEPLAAHSKSGMPLTKEFRIFWLDGEPIFSTEYWEEGDYQNSKPPIDDFRKVANVIRDTANPGVRSRFFTMDVAQRRNGDWMIVELGDAQVAGLPDSTHAEKFYAALIAAL
jgi:hypothetical protein